MVKLSWEFHGSVRVNHGPVALGLYPGTYPGTYSKLVGCLAPHFPNTSIDALGISHPPILEGVLPRLIKSLFACRIFNFDMVDLQGKSSESPDWVLLSQ